ncbi:MAG: type I restriction enzyme HsdR N-terminal domain-containing protein [Nitrospirae bacterium]|nr:type I restriction enzyme HsdR N-terminal domain-containing protein [Nitrospirota bacterium]
MDYKLPEGFDNKEDAIDALLKKEFETVESMLSAVRHRIERFLLEAKGYSRDEIETACEFDVTIGCEAVKSTVDLAVCINGKRIVSIKCAPDSLVSRERHALACARLLDSYQVPFAVVTDGLDAIVLDTVSGDVIGESMNAIPSKKHLASAIAQIEFIKLDSKRIEKEKRIVRAFDAIGCSGEL